MNNSQKLGTNLKNALNEEIQRRENAKNKQISNYDLMRMIISSVKEAEAKQQKNLEDIIKSKDEEIERLSHICSILKTTNEQLAKKL